MYYEQNFCCAYCNLEQSKTSIKFTEKQTPKMDVLSMKFSYDPKEIEWLPNPLLKAYNIHMPKEMGKEFTRKYKDHNYECTISVPHYVMKDHCEIRNKE